MVVQHLHLLPLILNPTYLNKVPIKLEWYDGGLRPSYPSLIPTDTYLGGKTNANGVIIIGDEGIITTDVYGKNPRLFTKDKKVIHLKLKIYQKMIGDIKKCGLMLLRTAMEVLNIKC